MLWVWGVSLPIVYLNSVDDPSEMSVVDSIGAALAGVGFLMEWVADVQKHRFRADPLNSGKVCNVGLWSVTRHPNYFGKPADVDMPVWVGECRVRLVRYVAARVQRASGSGGCLVPAAPR